MQIYKEKQRAWLKFWLQKCSDLATLVNYSGQCRSEATDVRTFILTENDFAESLAIYRYIRLLSDQNAYIRILNMTSASTVRHTKMVI